MKKKVLIAQLTAAVLLLSGCSSLVLRDSAVDNQQTIIAVNGEHVTKETFLALYNYNLTMQQYYAQLMAQLGASDGSVDSEAIVQSTLQSLVTSIVINQKAAELGLDQFTDEEKAQLDAEAKEQFESKSAGSTDTLESIRTDLQNNKIVERVKASVTDTVTIDDAALQAALEQKIEDQKSSYASNANAYNSNVTAGSTIYYVPEGYRVVRQFRLTKPTADENEEVDLTEFNAQAADMAQRAAAQQPMDGLDVNETEYRLCKESTLPSAEQVAAAMALTEKGAVTDLIETDALAIVLRYEDDVAPYTASLEDVRDGLYEETLANAQDEAYNAALTEWVNAADIQFFLDRLN